jgi:uncharacterized protein
VGLTGAPRYGGRWRALCPLPALTVSNGTASPTDPGRTPDIWRRPPRRQGLRLDSSVDLAVANHTVVIFLKPGVGMGVIGMEFQLIYTKSRQQYYFRLVASNGKIICWSEQYETKASCLAAIGLVMDTDRRTPVKEYVVG